MSLPPIDPNRHTPSDIRKAITDFGGLNPYGEPMWRLCVAEDCLIQCNGVMHEMPMSEGTDEGQWVNGKWRTAIETTKPTSSRGGTHWIPKYPADNPWVLEKWFPASMVGSPEAWAAARASKFEQDGLGRQVEVESGERLLCEYPARGIYHGLSFHRTRPELGDVRNAISEYMYAESIKPTNFAKAMARQLMDEEDRKAAKAYAYAKELAQYRKSEIMPVLQGTSLAAQGVRNDLQKKLGRTSHLGANEF